MGGSTRGSVIRIACLVTLTGEDKTAGGNAATAAAASIASRRCGASEEAEIGSAKGARGLEVREESSGRSRTRRRRGYGRRRG
jgi:hypothetical protein